MPWAVVRYTMAKVSSYRWPLLNPLGIVFSLYIKNAFSGKVCGSQKYLLIGTWDCDIRFTHQANVLKDIVRNVRHRGRVSRLN